MLNKIISISFILLFVSTIVLPSTIVFVDDTIDISYFNDFSEEEEEKGQESNYEFNFLFSETTCNEVALVSNEINQTGIYISKIYNKPYFNLIIPPPDSIFSS